MVRTRAELARVLAARGRFEEAERLYRRALESNPDLLTVQGQRTAQVASGYGALLTGMGRYAEAERQLVEVLDFVQEHLGVKDPRTRYTLGLLVSLYEGWGKREKAAAYRVLLKKGKPAGE